MRKLSVKFFTIFLFISASFVELSAHEHAAIKGKEFIENKNQWDQQALFRAEMHGLHLYLEKNGFTYHFFDKEFSSKMHGFQGKPKPEDFILRQHAVKVRFLGANPNVQVEKAFPSQHYYNYFIGKDPSKWASQAYAYKKVMYKELYKGIDLEIYFTNKSLKYDFIVKPGADPNQIKIAYEGDEGLELVDGALLVKTSLENFMESKPLVYQDLPENEVKSAYKLDEKVLSFQLGKYNKKETLIIDPTLVFGTFSGSTSDNWGFSATYDDLGNAYSAGIVIGTGGLPITPGAFQVNFNTGGPGAFNPIDIGILKYNPTGSTLIYATYLGGNGNELPHSLMVNGNNELYIYGTTGSADFPITQFAFQQNFAGGPTASMLNDFIVFQQGTDMFVSRLNESGTQLFASTYIGGTGNDGINSDPALKYNYADDARGTIFINETTNRVYVGSTTSSNNFPVTPNAFQSTYGGGVQDAVLFQFDVNLNTLIFSSYLGGTGADAIYTLMLDGQNNVLASGGTTSNNLPATPGAFQGSLQGGTDGFIAKFTANGQNILALTYYGTSAYDQAYFVETDKQNNVYVFGQTTGNDNNFFINNVNYSNQRGNQFVTKFNPNLTQRVWSTAFGNGFGWPDLVPSAFLVDLCGRIYTSGWGAAFNFPTPGSVQGLPITPDAFQPNTTNGNDFHLMVLGPDANNLLYGTYLGGPFSSDHVDGGTSRFDKRAIIYQSVCAGCGGNSDMPTTPGAWSQTNNAQNCNNGLWKFDFQLPLTVASFTAPVAGCVPFSADFINTSIGGSQYEWNFGAGPGSVSTDVSPSFTYTEPGVYVIRLVAFDPNTCNIRDTTFRSIIITESTRDTLPMVELCINDATVIGFDPGPNPYLTYSWSPEQFLNNATIAQPSAFPTDTTTFTLFITSFGNCVDTLSQTVNVNVGEVEAGPDITICLGQTIEIGIPDNSGNFTYQWEPSNLVINDATLPNPLVNPTATTTFTLYRAPVSAQFGCPAFDSLTVIVVDGSPSAEFDYLINPNCRFATIQFTNTGSGADEFLWVFSNGETTSAENPSLILEYDQELQVFFVAINSACRDTLDEGVTIKPLKDYFVINNSNVFTPNGDGINDCFSPALQNAPSPSDKTFLECSELVVYNRWGVKVYDSKDWGEGCWNGKTEKGEAYPEGVYFFYFRTETENLHGTVTLKL
ncbi:MAG: gliding motility-associated C-terminal domain-containing protein [Flavobacteriales bacterium]